MGKEIIKREFVMVPQGVELVTVYQIEVCENDTAGFWFPLFNNEIVYESQDSAKKVADHMLKVLLSQQLRVVEWRMEKKIYNSRTIW